MIQENLSPFKFLDAYQKEDKEIFFGRKDEVKELYHSLSGVKQLLLYGPSGSGKTSLIECGLRNKFSDLDWLAITIRRGNDINLAFSESVNKLLIEKISPKPDPNSPKVNDSIFTHFIQKLYEQSFRPIYLLFDQFEELLIQGIDEEKRRFFQNLNKLIQFKVPCKVILIMREDFIGHLSEFENLCPSLFQNRFRVEKMGKKAVHSVIHDILTSEYYLKWFDVEFTELLCDAIIKQLPDEKQEIELAHVQVFLGELWDRAVSVQTDNRKPLFKDSLIKDGDNLKSVLGTFLKKQFDALDPVFGEKTSLEVLSNMVTKQYTKLQVTEDALKKKLEADKIELKKSLIQLLGALEQRRIIRTVKVGEETKYELSHDVLAKLVGESLTENMKLREKAQELYDLYENRTDDLGQGEINNLLLYKTYRAYPDGLKNLLEKSVSKIEFEKNEKVRLQKRQLKHTKIFAAFIFILAVGVIISLIFAKKAQQEARDKERIATTALINFKITLAQRDSLRFKELETRAKTIIAVKGRPLEILDSMRSIYKTYNDTVPKMRWIYDSIDVIDKKMRLSKMALPNDE